MLVIAHDTNLAGQIQRLKRQAKARTPDILMLLKNAYDLGQTILPSKMSPYSKDQGTYEPAQLFAIHVFRLHRNLSYRDTAEEFQTSWEKRAVIGLTQVPHYTALQKFFAKLPDQAIEMAQRLSALNDPWENPGVTLPVELFPELLKPRHERAAADSTGFALTQASRYYAKRTGQAMKEFVKLSINGALETQKILAAVVDWGPCSDHAEFKTMIEQTEAIAVLDLELGDAGYDSEQNHEFCFQKGIQSVIPALVGRPGPARSPFRKKMQQEFPQELYAQRSKATETIYSVMKRKSGGVIRSRRKDLQLKEGKLRVVVYNLYRDVVRVKGVPLHQVN